MTGLSSALNLTELADTGHGSRTPRTATTGVGSTWRGGMLADRDLPSHHGEHPELIHRPPPSDEHSAAGRFHIGGRDVAVVVKTNGTILG